MKKVGLIIDQAFDYVETFYDNTKQKINNVDLEKETKEKLTNLNIKVDNYLKKLVEDYPELEKELEWDIDYAHKILIESQLYLDKAQELAYVSVPYRHELIDELEQLVAAMRRDYPLK